MFLRVARVGTIAAGVGLAALLTSSAATKPTHAHAYGCSNSLCWTVGMPGNGVCGDDGSGGCSSCSGYSNRLCE